MAKKNGKRIKIKIIAILLIAVFIGATYFARVQIEGLINGKSLASGTVEEANTANFAVHYINVGQGDSCLITLPDGKNMLIDAGPGDAEDKVVNYLKNLNITAIDYLVLTHSDEDHSGGMDKVLENFDVSTIYRPFQIALSTKSFQVEDPLQYYLEDDEDGVEVNSVSTACYNAFIKLAYSEKDKDGNDANVCVFYDGLVIENASSGYKFEFFAPLKIAGAPAIGGTSTTEDLGAGFPTVPYDNKNDYSPFIYLTYQDSSFVFTGDMEKDGEADFVASLTAEEKTKLSGTDVYKCGHHGSRTSSSEDLLDILRADYYIISCGKDNSYGHPHAELMTKVNNALQAKGFTNEGRIYRTDENGDIIFYAKESEIAICAYNFTQTHYFTWFELAGGAFIVLSLGVICIGSPSAYKKVKKYAKK